MDQSCSFEQLQGCLRDIARVNRLTFAYRPTLLWLEELVRRVPSPGRPLHIVDVGCGFGDSLRTIRRWSARRSLSVTLTGIDLNLDAVRAAIAATPEEQGEPPIRFLHGDAFSFTGEIDVVLSSLLTHHLEESEIVAFLRWMEASARVGWFINDLERRPLPYYAFRVMAGILPFHPFVRHDGAVSIRRSFRTGDWRHLCAAAGLRPENVSIRGYRPARLCVGRVKG